MHPVLCATASESVKSMKRQRNQLHKDAVTEAPQHNSDLCDNRPRVSVLLGEQLSEGNWLFPSE